MPQTNWKSSHFLSFTTSLIQPPCYYDHIIFTARNVVVLMVFSCNYNNWRLTIANKKTKLKIIIYCNIYNRRMKEKHWYVVRFIYLLTTQCEWVTSYEKISKWANQPPGGILGYKRDGGSGGGGERRRIFLALKFLNSCIFLGWRFNRVFFWVRISARLIVLTQFKPKFPQDPKGRKAVCILFLRLHF